MKKILVTGGAGYIGDAVVQFLLDRKCKVVVVDNLLYGGAYTRPGMKFIYADVSDRFITIPHILEKEKPDAVIHLAAIVGDGACQIDSQRTINVNEESTKTLALLCARNNIRFVFASTCSVYGANNEVLNEDSPTSPLSLYAGTKLAAERLIQDKVPNHVILRLGTLFGMSTEHARIRCDLVANILTYLAAQNKTLNVHGGSQWRPLLHVRDAAEFFAQAALGFGDGLYVASKRNITIIELAKIVIEQVGQGQIRTTERRFEDLRNYKVDNTKAYDAGFIPSISLEEGINEMANVMKEGRIANVWSPQFHNAKYIGGDSGS